VDNTKVIIKRLIPKVCMDGITDKMMIGEGGFDPASIKKTDRGDYYGLEWELFMGQKFALAQPPVA